MSGADRLEDGYPHGTVEGFKRGCRSGYCPAGNEHGLSCKRAKQLAAGDYRYSRLVKRGATPGEIADELGLVPETHEPPMWARRGDDKEVGVVKQSKDRPEPTPDDEKRRRAEIRAWARENGVMVGARGRIPQAIVIGWLNDDPTLGGKIKPARPKKRLGEMKPTVQPPALSEPVEHELAAVSATVDEMEATSLGQRIVSAIVHAPVVPDMETRAELFNEGFEEAEAQFGPVVDDLVRAEGALELVLTKWNAERQRRLDAESLVFALSAEVRSLTEQLRREPPSFDAVVAALWKTPETDERGVVISTGTTYRIEARVTPALRGAHTAARKPWWKRWAS